MVFEEKEVAMGRYDTAVKCAQIRSLIEEKQYLTAMEEIEDLDLEKISTISDLYLFADVFLKAEKMDIAKELYYIVYRRTASRPALYRLLMLVIQMGDIEEAKELYLAYEVIAGNTLDTYELRYRLAKAEGKPRAKLIEILEHLKADEYTEEWGFQLAKLYELEGMREKCIEECESLKCWFGTGKIVKKAEELKKKCMSPTWRKPDDESIPEPETPDEEETASFAYAPVRVEEIAPVREEIQTEEEGTGSVEETEEKIRIPQPEVREQTVEVRVEPEVPEPTFRAEPQPEPTFRAEPESPVQPQAEPVMEEVPESQNKRGFMKRLVDYFKIDVDMFEESMDAEDKEPTEPDDERQSQPAVEPVQPDVSQTQVETLEVEQVTAAAEPIESLDDRLQKMNGYKEEIEPLQVLSDDAPVKSHPLGASAVTEDIVEHVSKNGIRYNTLKGIMYKIRQEQGIINIALTGGAGTISLAVAKRLSKELKKIGYFEAKHIGKISADRLDTVNLDEWVEKFIGGCMYITEAPSLSNQSVKNLSDLIKKYQKQIVIILEGSYDEMDSFLNYHKEFETLITYKVRL